MSASTSQTDRARRAARQRVPSDVFDACGVSVFGVLNTTPDSFSDGGRFADAEGPIDVAGALAAAKDLAACGAQVIDVGGESTRPGAHEVALEVECERTAPVIAALAAGLDEATAISIDTRKAAVAEAALTAGATIVNDVSGLAHDPALAEVSPTPTPGSWSATCVARRRRCSDRRTTTTCSARWRASSRPRSMSRAARACAKRGSSPIRASASASASRTTTGCSPPRAGYARGSACLCSSVLRARASWVLWSATNARRATARPTLRARSRSSPARMPCACTTSPAPAKQSPSPPRCAPTPGVTHTDPRSRTSPQTCRFARPRAHWNGG